MSLGTIIFLLLFVGIVTAMFRMHRGGGHAHGMGGCGGHAGHGGHGTRDTSGAHNHPVQPTQQDAPALGKPDARTNSHDPHVEDAEPVASRDERHRGC